jgi:hypothetical protein
MQPQQEGEPSTHRQELSALEVATTNKPKDVYTHNICGCATFRGEAL